MAGNNSAGSTKKNVIVVGGGIAGITAASRLSGNQNFNVTLLEASDRLGGRVWTSKQDRAGDVLDIIEKGAQWVHGEGSTYTLAKSFGDDILENDPFLDRMETNTDFAMSNGQNITSPEILRKFLELFKILRNGPSEKDCHLLSVGDWFLKRVNNGGTSGKESQGAAGTEVTAFIDWLERLQVSIDGSDTWYESSVRGQLEYINCPGCPTILWKQGYDTLTNIILNESPTNADLPNWVKLNSKVTRIDYSNRPIVIKTEVGTLYESDAVVVAIPLGVLKSDHLDLFQPELPPGKVRTIQNLGFGTVNKIHVTFNTAWWEPDWLGLNLLWTDEDSMEFPPWAINLLGFYTSKTCPYTLTSWITGEYARAIEKVNEDELTDMVLVILRRFLKNNKISRPSSVSVTKWFNDPLFRGSYSFRSVQSEEKDVWAKDLAQPIPVGADGLLCFAGEATHNSFYSTVHGAHDTGVREANRIIQFYADINATSKNNTSPPPSPK